MHKENILNNPKLFTDYLTGKLCNSREGTLTNTILTEKFYKVQMASYWINKFTQGIQVGHEKKRGLFLEMS